jgi:EAL domain-containing protein (putative c-di-GMP-specific phosphodiesterase class I)
MSAGETRPKASGADRSNCDEMQGFLLGKPVSEDDFGALLRGRRMAA